MLSNFFSAAIDALHRHIVNSEGAEEREYSADVVVHYGRGLTSCAMPFCAIQTADVNAFTRVRRIASAGGPKADGMKSINGRGLISNGALVGGLGPSQSTR